MTCKCSPQDLHDYGPCDSDCVAYEPVTMSTALASVFSATPDMNHHNANNFATIADIIYKDSKHKYPVGLNVIKGRNSDNHITLEQKYEMADWNLKNKEYIDGKLNVELEQQKSYAQCTRQDIADAEQDNRTMPLNKYSKHHWHLTYDKIHIPQDAEKYYVIASWIADNVEPQYKDSFRINSEVPANEKSYHKLIVEVQYRKSETETIRNAHEKTTLNNVNASLMARYGRQITQEDLDLVLHCYAKAPKTHKDNKDSA